MNGPRDEEEANRRRHGRTPLALLVQFRFSSLEEFLAEYAVNLSPGGLFINTETPRAEGDIIHVQFSLKDGSQLIEGMGRVVRVITPGTPGRPPGMGVEFLDLDARSRALVETVCAARQPRLG
jgi:uncharacterized protein (TIGR02266 family)